MRCPGAALAGRTVLVTRPARQAAALEEPLRARGARTVRAPAISVAAAPAGRLDAALRGAAGGRFAWLVLTSPRGVLAVARRLPALGLTWRDLSASARVAAIGDGTAGALEQGGGAADLLPTEFTTRALGRAFPTGSGAVLLARADLATGELEDVLRAKGWDPVRVDAYRVRPATSLPAAARRELAAGHVDAVTFTSASSVRAFTGLAADLLSPSTGRTAAGRPAGPAIVCIGPVTAAEVRSQGMRVRRVASPHTIEGLVEAVERALGGRRGEKEGS